MDEISQPSERSPKNAVRIVYHAPDRTFARLFKERSLDQVKDAVRRKLGLGPEIDVSLKQVGPGALLDLDDDDDFQAFRVFATSSVSVDIQVTVAKSLDTSVPAAVASQPREQSSAAAESISVPSLSSKESLTQASARTEATGVTKPSTVVKKAPETLAAARKRRVSFDDAPVAALDKSTEQQAQPISIPAILVSSANVAEIPATTKSTHPEEPPKKKQKKDTTKAKNAQPTESVEEPSTKTSSVKKPRVKKSAALDRGTEVATSVSKDGEASELPAKKSQRRKKDDGSLPKKSSALPDPDGMDQPVSQPDPINDTSVQLPSERRVSPSEDGGVLGTSQDEEKIGVCAAIPQTIESTNVRSEVVAAILADILSRGSETVSPPPPAKRKSVKKDTQRSLASSSASLLRPTAANTSSSGTPKVPTETGHEQAVAIDETPSRTREPKGPLCPICLGEPFHIRYRCPTVLKGVDAIRERLEEVKKSNAGEQQSLIKELEGLLRGAEVTAEPSLNATPPQIQPLDASVSRTPIIPSSSNISEVAVESRDEGSSSESSDDTSEGRNEHNKKLPALLNRKTPDRQPSPSNDNLEAVIRGPALRRQSILHVLNRISKEDNKDSESGEDEDDIELEEGREDEIVRSSSRLSKHVVSSSEAEEEGSTSPSPSLSAQDNPGAGVQGSIGPVQISEYMGHPDDDVVMENCVDSSVLRSQDDDSSEETHVGSEDRMEVDAMVGENGDTAVVEEQPFLPPSKAPLPEPLNEPNSVPQESRETEVVPTADGDGRTPVAPEVSGVAEVDPIEPADELEPPTTSRMSNSDLIEALPEDAGSLRTGVDQSSPKPGVTKRMKTRDGQILHDEAEHPVLLEQPATSITKEETPLPTKEKPRRKATATPTSQEQEPTRRRTRSRSLIASTNTPAAATLLNPQTKSEARSAKTPARRSERRTASSQVSTKDDQAQIAARPVPNPPLANWETLAEPSSPSPQLDEPSADVDELMSSSQLKGDALVGRVNAESTPAQKERLFDLSSSQIPFPYSQHKSKVVPTSLNGKEKEVATDSGSEQEAKVTKKATPFAYRSLSQLASQAVHFSPSLPTPINKSVTSTKTKKRAVDEDSTSSSSTSDEEEANTSHIPLGRRAGAKLETKKRKSLLSRV